MLYNKEVDEVGFERKPLFNIENVYAKHFSEGNGIILLGLNIRWL